MGFSGKLKMLRGDLTQTAFAKKLEIPQNTYHRYEKGERVPDIKALSKISKSLNISADELLGLADLKHSASRNGHLSNSNSVFDTKDATIAKQAETIVNLTRSLKKIVANCPSRG
jgi:transcriptional regulator with XRE-family HTH domain